MQYELRELVSQLTELQRKLNNFYRHNNIIAGLIFANNEGIAKLTAISSHKIGYFRNDGYSEETTLDALELFLTERNSRIHERMSIQDINYVFETLHKKLFVKDETFPINISYEWLNKILDNKSLAKPQTLAKIIKKLLWVKSRFLIIPRNKL